MAALSRITRELALIQKDPPPGCGAQPKEEGDLFHWIAYISGPPDSPYEGGKFYLSLSFGKNYPFKPPACQFLTAVYHPNISVQGYICLDILFNDWTPSFTIGKLLVGLTSLLCDPNLEHGLRPALITEYQRNRAGFDANARKWTTTYAMKNSPTNPNSGQPQPTG